jgi:hypothetical protein
VHRRPNDHARLIARAPARRIAAAVSGFILPDTVKRIRELRFFVRWSI